MPYEYLLVATSGAVTTITLNRPKALNALNRATLRELDAALRAVEADLAVRVAILTGAGERAFVAGADIGELRAQPSAIAAQEFALLGHQIGRTIAGMSKIVIAAVNGFALGGGCELAMSCDIRLAADTARFGQPEINLGLMPGWGGTQRLPRLVGAGMAAYLNLTGELISAEEALRIGLVERVYPAAELPAAAQALAEQIASKAPLAVAAIKQAIIHGLNMPLPEACQYEATLFGGVVVSEDGREGTAAFLEKRPPLWKGL